jgi:hypothetical protein
VRHNGLFLFKRRVIPIKKINRIGEIYYKKDGSKLEIIDYRNAFDIDVRFENGYVAKNISYYNFKKGKLRNPYDKNLHGIGFIGIGRYNSRCRHYQTWTDMLDRCYSNKYHSEKPSYLECTLDEEWHNFQSFAEWYDNNFYQVDNEEMNLDKDILVRGNKKYSPNTCIFVPQRINKLFIRQNLVTKNNLPMGVCKHGKRFKAQCAHSGKNTHIGIYETPDEAHLAYKRYKEALIKEIATSYRSSIPENLYNSLMSYEI